MAAMLFRTQQECTEEHRRYSGSHRFVELRYSPGIHRGSAMSDNPYEAPAARVDDPGNDDADTAIRRPLLRHEASLRSVGWLYWLGALVLGFAGVVMLPQALSTGPQGDFGYGFVIVAVVYLVLAIASAITGWGFRTLAPWVRIPGGILSGIGLLGIPVGTLINGYILYLMFGAKGRRILSDDYAAIRARTPHLRFTRGTGEKIGIALVLLVPAGLLAWLIARG
jgi:hypothetical protein